RFRRGLESDPANAVALAGEARTEVRLRSTVTSDRNRRIAAGAARAFEHLLAELRARRTRARPAHGVAGQRAASVDQVPAFALLAFEACRAPPAARFGTPGLDVVRAERGNFQMKMMAPTAATKMAI